MVFDDGDFFAACRDRLTGNGVLAVNLWGSDKRFPEYRERLAKVFDGRVLCLPARELDFEKAIGITHTWLMTPFAGAARYKRRIEQLDQLGG